jgi:hypothetical protein
MYGPIRIPIQRIKILHINSFFIIARFPKESMHDTTILIQFVNDFMGNSINGGRVDDDFVVLRHFGKKFIDSWSLCESPSVFAVPGCVHECIFQV